LSPDLSLGLSMAYARSDLSQKRLANEASVDATSLTVYGGWRANRIYVNGALGYGYSSIETTRALNIQSASVITAEAKGRTHGNQLMGELEAGYDLAMGATTLTPFVGLQSSVLWQSAYTEDGADSLNMKVGATRTPSIRTVLGADARHSLEVGTKGKLDVTLRAAWAHELKNGTRAVDLAFAAVPTAAFRAEGVRAQKDSALIGLGLGTALSGDVSGFVRYDGDLGKKDQINTISAGLRFGW
jgi:outer membrane autotransporter protein